jgi:hypothetical protein
MALGINREEMELAAAQMYEDRKWHDILQSLIKKYEHLSRLWHLRSVDHIDSELLTMQCRARSSAYKEAANDLRTIQPLNWQ